MHARAGAAARIGRLAGLIVGCDALVDWCSWLLDQGYRGEMECIVAKIFGSEAQKEAAIELFMKTHGGRAFLHGHLFGDNVHEYLAPCIYEGEGEMLGMGFFKSLIKEHGKTYFEPIGKALAGTGNQAAQPAQPGARLGAARAAGAITPSGWSARRSRPDCPGPTSTACPPTWPRTPAFAASGLQRRPAGDQRGDAQAPAQLADRQCRMSELSHAAARPRS